jgi:hypothetical protein
MKFVLLADMAVGFIGGVLLTYGVFQWSRPGGFVVAGLLLIAVAAWPTSVAVKGMR